MAHIYVKAYGHTFTLRLISHIYIKAYIWPHIYVKVYVTHNYNKVYVTHLHVGLWPHI